MENNFDLNNHDIIKVGDEYLKRITDYASDGTPFPNRIIIKKETAQEQCTKGELAKIPKFDKTVIVPSHTNFQEVMGNCINRYYKLTTIPKEGEFPTWQILMERVFGEQVGLGWIYLAIAYQLPTQILPVLCLVSQENQTGKSTFGNALSFLFGQNVGFFTQVDLESPFNTWVMSLFAVFEEVSDTKITVNRIKAISTAKNITVNAKYRQPVNVSPFVKIIILANNDETFVRANKHDIRYWVRHLAPLTPEDFDPDFEDKLKQEAPAVLYYLHNMQIGYKKRSRMWFAPEDIRTEALEKVINRSRSDVAQDLELLIHEKLSEHNNSFYATASDFKTLLGNRYSLYQISKALKEELGYTMQKQMRFEGLDGEERNGTPFFFTADSLEQVF